MRREILETQRKSCLAELGDAVCVCVCVRETGRQTDSHPWKRGGARGQWSHLDQKQAMGLSLPLTERKMSFLRSDKDQGHVLVSGINLRESDFQEVIQEVF